MKEKFDVVKNVYLKCYHAIFDTKAILITYFALAAGLIFWFVKTIMPHFGSEKRALAYFGLIIVLMLCGVGYFLIRLLSKKTFKFERVFLFTVILWGTVMNLVLPGAVCADGHVHLGTSYMLSNFFCGHLISSYEYDETTNQFTSFVRLEEMKGDRESLGVLSEDMYRSSIYSDWLHGEDDGKLHARNDYVYYNIGKKGYARYLPAALGIAVGRLFGLGQMGVLFMAKFFNTLFFALLGYISIKILPIGKGQMTVIAMIPMLVETYGGMHYDLTLNALTIWLCSFLLYLAYREKPVGLLDYVILGLTVIYLVPQKYVFTSLVLLFFMIPKENRSRMFQNKKLKRAFIILVIIGAGFSISKEWYAIIAHMIPEQGGYDFFYCLRHPLIMGEIILRTLLPRNLLNQLMYIMGALIGHNQFVIPFWPLILMSIVVVISFFVCRGKGLDKEKAKTAAKCIVFTTWLTYAAVIFDYPREMKGFGLLLFGRYLIPIVAPMMILLGTDAKENRNMVAVYYVQSILLAIVMCTIMGQVL